MKFLADECCDAALVQALRTDGHDVLYALESLRGGSDDEILSRALAKDRLLLTEDKDFGELVYRLRRPAYGVILLRFDVADRLKALAWMIADGTLEIKVVVPIDSFGRRIPAETAAPYFHPKAGLFADAYEDRVGFNGGPAILTKCPVLAEQSLAGRGHQHDHALATGSSLDPKFAKQAQQQLGLVEWEQLRNLVSPVKREKGQTTGRLKQLSPRAPAGSPAGLDRHASGGRRALQPDRSVHLELLPEVRKRA